jgi:large subunit ribosomal protein L22
MKQAIGENQAKAFGDGLPISTKVSVEICRQVRNKRLQRAKDILQDAIDMKKPIPFKKMHGCGHRPGIGPGRYPIKACTEILKLLNSAEANAQFKGLSVKNLVITKIVPNEPEQQWHYGRLRRRKHKRTTIEIVLTEVAEKKAEKKEEKTEGKKEEPKKAEVKPKVEAKPEAKKEEVKPKPEPKKEEKPKETVKEEPKTEAKPEEKKEMPKEVKEEAPKEIKEEKKE